MSCARGFPTLLCTYLLLLFGLCSNQEVGAQGVTPPRQGNPNPAGTIGGSKTLELVSDELAFRMVFRAFAEPENPTPEESERLKRPSRSQLAGGRRDESPLGFVSDGEATNVLTTEATKLAPRSVP